MLERSSKSRLIARILGLLILAGTGSVVSYQSPLAQIDKQSAANESDDAPGVENAHTQSAGAVSTVGDKPSANAENEPSDKQYWLDRHSGSVQSVLFALLVILTFFYVRFTLRLWHATKLAAEHIPIVERAYVKMSHLSPPGLEVEKATGLFGVRVRVKNFGRTPAKVTDTLLKPVVIQTGEQLPVTPDYSRHRQFDSAQAFLVAGDRFTVGAEAFTIGEKMAEVNDGTAILYLIGYVDYIDAFGQRHRGGYARRYVPGRMDNNLVFVTEGTYNYDRPRKPGEGRDWAEDDSQQQQ